MNNYVVKTISAGACQGTKERAWGRDIKCQVVINIFSCKSWRKLLNTWTQSGRSALSWCWSQGSMGDTSCFLSVGTAACDNLLVLSVNAKMLQDSSCRKATFEGQGSSCSSTGQICVHSWATNPSEASKSPSWATLKISALLFSPRELVLFPLKHHSKLYCQRKKHFWMRMSGEWLEF